MMSGPVFHVAGLDQTRREEIVIVQLCVLQARAIPLIVAMSASFFPQLGHGQQPLGLPPVVAPAGNPQTFAKVVLGRALFDDKRLSADNSTSCATCHLPTRAFSDGLPVARGTQRRLGVRNTPTVLNAAYAGTQFWDGRRDSLESQAIDPFTNTAEHGLVDRDSLLKLIRGDDRYTEAFSAAFGVQASDITADLVAMAIAAFERTLVAGNSPFDRYEYAGDSAALSAAAIRGLSLFRGRARCGSCHRIDKDYALLTDGAFHRLGVGQKRIESRLAELANMVVSQPNLDVAKAMQGSPELSELGRFLVTRKVADIGRFKTPSLRNVALTAPYMHDGSVTTLEEAVDTEIYYRSIESGRPLILTPREKADLVEFLKSLTSPEFAGSKDAASIEER